MKFDIINETGNQRSSKSPQQRPVGSTVKNNKMNGSGSNEKKQSIQVRKHTLFYSYVL